MPLAQDLLKKKKKKKNLNTIDHLWEISHQIKQQLSDNVCVFFSEYSSRNLENLCQGTSKLVMAQHLTKTLYFGLLYILYIYMQLWKTIPLHSTRPLLFFLFKKNLYLHVWQLVSLMKFQHLQKKLANVSWG